MSYKNCYAVREPDNWGYWNVHLWTDEGYSVESFQNYGYQECNEHQSTHRGLKGEPLKKVTSWDKNAIDLHYADHTREISILNF